ncbi:MAG: histidine phosphatase family protein [Clostridia bacterium]|nr:histidine phosphatase family protein [Clostridia bacterium]
MYLYIVRHGKPNYDTGDLFPEGVRQAEAAAARLSREGITKIYSSPMPRALQTAAPLCEALKKESIVCPWAKELGKESKTTYPDGQKKTISLVDPTLLWSPANRLLSAEETLKKVPSITENAFPERYKEISDGLDGLLKEEGYLRTEEGFYQAVSPTDEHVALFCHVAMTRVMLSHLYSLPYTFLGALGQAHFTGITVLYFPTEKDALCLPYLISYGDIGHLYGEENLAGPHYHFGDLF